MWRHGAHYNTPRRVTVLVRQVANAVIAAAQRHVTGKAVFELVAEDTPGAAVSRLRTTAAVASALKKAYFAAKARASAEVPHRPWLIANGALFGRLDAFLGQLHDVGEVAAAATAYGKLEKMVVGGDRGQALCTAMEGLYADYRAALGALEAAPYDLLLEVDAARFAADMAEWRAHARALDRRLAATLRTALDDAPNVYARFKLLDSFDALLERAAVQVRGGGDGGVGVGGYVVFAVAGRVILS